MSLHFLQGAENSQFPNWHVYLPIRDNEPVKKLSNLKCHSPPSGTSTKAREVPNTALSSQRHSQSTTNLSQLWWLSFLTQGNKHCHHHHCHQKQIQITQMVSVVQCWVVPHIRINISEKAANSSFRIEDMPLSWRCREQDLLKHWNAATKLHKVISQMTATLTFTAVRSSDLSNFKIQSCVA